LAPHRSYTREIALLLSDPAVKVRGFAHITGGGIGGNLKRILPPGLDAIVRPNSWVEPPVFGFLRQAGNVAEEEMRAAFNLGMGLIAVVGDGAAAMAKIERRKSVRVAVSGKKATPRAFLIGQVVRGGGKVRFESQ
jgi:phosphoribosylformylglycinamidine cyclo-ligase